MDEDPTKRTISWKAVMYLINWNPNESRLEASFGGCITNGEADVFLDEIQEYFEQCKGKDFALILDYATVKRLDDNVLDRFSNAREAGQFAGASKTVFVARDEKEATELTESRLQHVIEGREEYVPYRWAA